MLRSLCLLGVGVLGAAACVDESPTDDGSCTPKSAVLDATCDGVDDDCDGVVDEDCPSAEPCDPQTGSCGALPSMYFRVGETSDLVTTTTPGTVLMGGSVEVDDAFTWMCGLSGGGDFLVIRATGTDAYNSYVEGLCPELNSVATLIIPTTAAANEPTVAATLARAEAIWIAGGDQSNYTTQWTGTPVQLTLQHLIEQGVPVGGTSAGLNVLTPFVYSAEGSAGVTSAQALANPFHPLITMVRNFVTVAELVNTLGDPHFATRDRMGRDLAFLGRVYTNGWSGAPRGIAVDEETALLVDGDGSGVVVGLDAVYFLAAPGAPEVCLEATPLTYRDIAVVRVTAAGSFDLPTWTGDGGVSYSVSAEAGVLSSTQAGGSVY